MLPILVNPCPIMDKRFEQYEIKGRSLTLGGSMMVSIDKFEKPLYIFVTSVHPDKSKTRKFVLVLRIVFKP